MPSWIKRHIVDPLVDGWHASNQTGLGYNVATSRFESGMDRFLTNRFWNTAKAWGLAVTPSIGLLGLSAYIDNGGGMLPGMHGAVAGAALAGAGASLGMTAFNYSAVKAFNTLNEAKLPIKGLKANWGRMAAQPGVGLATVWGAGAVAGGIGAAVGGAGLYSVGIPVGVGLGALAAKSVIGGVARALGSPGDLIGAAGSLLSTAGRAAVGGLRGIEWATRAFLTGGVHGVASPLDAYMPWYRLAKPKIDITNAETGAVTQIPNLQKYAPNPRIIRRMTAAMAAASIFSGIHEAANINVAPPTAFFDGRYMRHINDMGANAHYARGILGSNSSLNATYNDAARVAAMML